MSEIFLIYPHMNPKGRWLVQNGDMLRVLSECCGHDINSMGENYGETWLQCLNCATFLQENERLWNTRVENIRPHNSEEAWKSWGQELFGLEDFELEISL